MTMVEYGKQIREGNKMLTRGLNKMYDLAVNKNVCCDLFNNNYWKLFSINEHLKSREKYTIIDIPSYIETINMVINNLGEFDTTGLNGRNRRTLKGIIGDFTKALNIWEVAYND